MNNLRKRIFDIIQIGQIGDVISRLFDILITIVILSNITAMFLETFSFFEREPYKSILYVIEIVTLILFCIEYLLRIWTADYLYPNLSRGRAIIKFLYSFDGIVDLLTIVSGLPFVAISGLSALRMLRVARIFHLFRINAYYDSFSVITSVVNEKKNQIIASVFIIFILMMGSSICMYSVEHEYQPDVFENAFSGIWWSISTILTVGYGDIYPITVLGRLLAIIIALLGVGVVAIPTGIISAGFVENYSKMSQTKDMTIPATVKAVVEKGSPFVGLTLEALEKQHNITPIVIIRGADIVLPGPKHKLKEGDQFVYQTQNLFNN